MQNTAVILRSNEGGGGVIIRAVTYYVNFHRFVQTRLAFYLGPTKRLPSIYNSRIVISRVFVFAGIHKHLFTLTPHRRYYNRVFLYNGSDVFPL